MHLFDDPQLQCKLDRIRMICFDVDGTLIDDHGGSANIWESLHRAFGVTEEENRKRVDHFFSGRITYAEWVDVDVGHWQLLGVTRADMLEVINRLGPVKGAPEAVANLSARGYKLAVISGSIDLGLETIFPGHPFKPVYINRIEFDANGLICGWRATPFDLARKESALRLIAEEAEMDLEQCAFVGDNFNDVTAVQSAGVGIAIASKCPELTAVCDIHLEERCLDPLNDIFPGF
jgi:HAD superfamily phosphoserine phosphatase-like hydrolase